MHSSKHITPVAKIEEEYSSLVNKLKNNILEFDKSDSISVTAIEIAAAIVSMRKINKNLDILSAIRQRIPSYMRDDGYSITMVKSFVYGVLANG